MGIKHSNQATAPVQPTKPDTPSLQWTRKENIYPSGQVELLDVARVSAGVFVTICSWDNGLTWTTGQPCYTKPQHWYPLDLARRKAIAKRMNMLKQMMKGYESAMESLSAEFLRMKASESRVPHGQ